MINPCMYIDKGLVHAAVATILLLTELCVTCVVLGWTKVIKQL